MSCRASSSRERAGDPRRRGEAVERHLPRYPRVPPVSAGVATRAPSCLRRGAPRVGAQVQGSLVVQLPGRPAGAAPCRRVRRRASPLRATAKWRDDASTLAAEDAQLATLAGGTTQARLAITLDPKDGGPLCQGIIGCSCIMIAALIQHYLTSSRQIDSPRMALAIAGNRVHGLLPTACCRAPGRGRYATWQRATRWRCHRAVRSPSPPPAGKPAAHCFPDEEVRLFKPQPTQFSCGCSEERIANALRLLGRGEGGEYLGRAGHDRRHM